MDIICVIGQMSEIFVEERKSKGSPCTHNYVLSSVDLPVIPQIRGAFCSPRKWPSSSQILIVAQVTFDFVLSTAYWCAENRKLY